MSNDKPAPSDAPPSAEAQGPNAATAKPAAPHAGRTRARLVGATALIAVAAGGYLYWKLQQSTRLPSVSGFEVPTPQAPPAPVPDAQEPTFDAGADVVADPPSAPLPSALERAPDAADDAMAVSEPDSSPDAADDADDPMAASAPAVPEEPPSLAGDVTVPRDVSPASGYIAEAPTPDASVPEALLTRIAELEATVAALAAAPPPLSADTATLAITEAGDLVALAEQRLALARDKHGAMAALRLATSRLSSGEFQAQRRAILADLAALEAFEDVDVAALSAELAAHARQALALPIAGLAPLAHEDDPHAPPVEGWRAVLGAVWGALRGLVEVREADETRDPLLNPAHAALARQQLALDLSAARIAVLQREAGDFRAALGPAINALQAQFDADDPAVADMLTRLHALGELDLAPTLPSLARSVDALAAVPVAAVPSAPPTFVPAAPLPETAL